MIIRLISLLVKGIVSASTDTKPVLRYDTGLQNLDKAYFDADFYFPYCRLSIGNLPRDIEFYPQFIGRVTLRKPRGVREFEIYETHIISDKELAMNVRMSYADFVMTGISSNKSSVVTKNQFFVLFINEEMNRFEVKSCIHEDITDKGVKSDFAEYLVSFLKEKYAAAGLSNPAVDPQIVAP